MNVIATLDAGAAFASLAALVWIGFAYFMNRHRDTILVLAGLLSFYFVFHGLNYLQWTVTKADFGFFDELGDLINVGIPLMWTFFLYALLQELYEADLKKSERRSVSLADDLSTANRELLEANRRLVEVDNARKSFVASISHELRTPLASIRGYAEIVLFGINGKVNEAQKRALETILRNNDRLDRLIRNLLEISKIDSGRFTILRKKCDIREALWHVEESFFPAADKQKKKIHCELPSDPVEIMLDEEYVVQAVSNLIDNAIRYAQENIYIHLTRSNNHVTVVVEDDGDAIAEEMRREVFDRFRRADSLDNCGHLGLGLAIVKEVARAHGGDVTLHARPEGAGNRFEVTLPILETKIN